MDSAISTAFSCNLLLTPDPFFIYSINDRGDLLCFRLALEYLSILSIRVDRGRYISSKICSVPARCAENCASASRRDQGRLL